MKPSSNMHRPTPPFGFITDRLRGTYSTKRKNSNYQIEKKIHLSQKCDINATNVKKEIEREIFQVFQTDSMALVNFLDYQNQRRFA